MNRPVNMSQEIRFWGLYSLQFVTFGSNLQNHSDVSHHRLLNCWTSEPELSHQIILDDYEYKQFHPGQFAVTPHHASDNWCATIYRNRPPYIIDTSITIMILIMIKRKVIVLDALDEIGSSGPGDRREISSVIGTVCPSNGVVLTIDFILLRLLNRNEMRSREWIEFIDIHPLAPLSSALLRINT